MAAAPLEHPKYAVDASGRRVLQSRLQDGVCPKERKLRNDSKEKENRNFYFAEHGNGKDWLGRVPSMRSISRHRPMRSNRTETQLTGVQ